MSAGVGKSCLLLRFAEDSFTSSFITTIGYVPAFVLEGTLCAGRRSLVEATHVCHNLVTKNSPARPMKRFLLPVSCTYTYHDCFCNPCRIDFKIKKIMIDGKWVKLQIWDTAGQERFRTITSAYYRGAMGIILVYDVTDESSFANIRNWMRNIEAHASEHVVKALVGNKSDVENSRRQVTYSQGAALAEEYRVPFFETSAKTSTNVDDAFQAVARTVMARLREAGATDNGTNTAGGGTGAVRLGAARGQNGVKGTTNSSSCC